MPSHPTPLPPYHVSPKSSLRQQANETLPHPSKQPVTPRDAHRVLPPWSMSTKDSDMAPGRASPFSLFSNASPTSRSQPHPSSPGSAPLQGGHKGSAGFSMAAGNRRASRFDPMGDSNGDEDEDGYGDLGSRHPLRRVTEEGSDEVINLPSIKSLFGRSGDGPGTPGPSGSHHTPTLPPLVPPSPSSTASPAMTYRTSRYPSSGSSFSTISENGVGWWAPEFERGSMPTSNTPTSSAPQSRSHSFPYAPNYSDDHDAKRRRSDQPVASGDPEEAARMRWQAQTRNASFPVSGSISGPSGGSGLRNAMAPPPSISPLPRGSVSHALPEERPTVPRSASVVGGQLARSFADLTAADRASVSRSPSMGPPVLPPPPLDRRPSLFPPAPLSQPMSSHSASLPLPAEDMRSTLAPLRGQSSPFSGSLNPETPTATPSRRLSVTRPSSPDRPVGPRRSSLTEIIKAKTGDDVAMASGRNPGQATEATPNALPRRASADSVNSTGRSASSTPVNRTRKRDAVSVSEGAPQDHSGGGSSSGQSQGQGNGQGAMHVLAEGATRAIEAEAEAEADAEGERDDDDKEPDQGGDKGGGGSGPKYSCAYCLKVFSRPSSLRIHTYSHTGERPFVCPEPSCRRRFSVQSNLKRHSKVHQGSGSAASSSSATATASTSAPAPAARPPPAAIPQPPLAAPDLYSAPFNQTPYSPIPPHAQASPHTHLHPPAPYGMPQPIRPQTATASLSPMQSHFPHGHSPGMASVSPDQHGQGRAVHPPPAQSPSYPHAHPGYGGYGYSHSPSHMSYPPLPPHQYHPHPHQQHPHHMSEDHHYMPHVQAEHQYYPPPMPHQYMPPPQSYEHPGQHYQHYPQHVPQQHAQYHPYPAPPSERYVQPSHGNGSAPGPSGQSGYAHRDEGEEGSDGDDAEGDIDLEE